MKKRIWLFHILNDYSGSPLVLKNTVLALENNHEVTICTSKGAGFLSNLQGVKYHDFIYQWSPNRWLTLMRFLYIQVYLFGLVIAKRHKIDIVYVNTLLPCGAALAGWLCGKEVIYHMHEPQISPKVLFLLLSSVASRTADKVVFVSNYLKSCFPKLVSRGIVIRNVLNKNFLAKALANADHEKNTVLMLCSNKEYKGVNDFVKLAQSSPEYNFELILNSSEESIAGFIEANKSIENLKVYPSQSNVHLFYSRARVVLNLSHPDNWVESFGMTVLEAMSYGIPCIVPEVGGVAELVTSKTGFKISHRNHALITEKLERIYADDNLYEMYSKEARERSHEYSFETYKKELLQLT